MPPRGDVGSYSIVASSHCTYNVQRNHAELRGACNILSICRLGVVVIRNGGGSLNEDRNNAAAAAVAVGPTAWPSVGRRPQVV